jgi:hypothetical protein
VPEQENIRKKEGARSVPRRTLLSETRNDAGIPLQVSPFASEGGRTRPRARCWSRPEHGRRSTRNHSNHARRDPRVHLRHTKTEKQSGRRWPVRGGRTRPAPAAGADGNTSTPSSRKTSRTTRGGTRASTSNQQMRPVSTRFHLAGCQAAQRASRLRLRTFHAHRPRPAQHHRRRPRR